MTWFFLAIAMAIGTAGIRVVNQTYRINGLYLVVFSRFILLMATLPLALAWPWPESPYFYLSTLATVPLVFYLDQRVFNLCAEFGGGPVSRLEPMNHVLTFLIWGLAQMMIVGFSFDAPIRTAIIFASIAGCCLFAFEMRRGEISAQVLKSMVPVIFVMTVTVIFSKLAMDFTDRPGDVAIYIFLQSVLLCLVGAGYFTLGRKWPKPKDLTPSFYKAIGLVAIFALVHMGFKSSAFRVVDNPAYVTVLDLTAPLWILLYNRLSHYPDNIKVLPGLGIVVCVAVLLLATNL